MQQRWSATEKDAYALHLSVLKFDLYLRGANFILHCNHKPLDPFLSKGIKIPKLNRWSKELADYNIKYIHIKGKHNILAYAISRLKMVNIYIEWFQNPKVKVVNNMQQVAMEVCATSRQTIGIICSAMSKSRKICVKH